MFARGQELDDKAALARALRPRLLAIVLVLIALTALTDQLARAQEQEPAPDGEPPASDEVAPGEELTAITADLNVDGNGVEGVMIRVSTADGADLGEAESGPAGQWAFELPGGGAYTTEIDVDSLPEGVFLVGDRTARSIRVSEGQSGTVLYNLSDVPPDERSEDTGPSLISQLVTRTADGLRLGMIIAVAAMGLSLIYGVTGLVNFAQGELVTFGAIAAWYLNVAGLGLHLVWAGILAVALSGAFGMGLDFTIFRPLRRRKLSGIALIVVSIGLALVLRHLYLLVFASKPRSYAQYVTQTRTQYGPLEIAPKEIAIIAIGTVAVLLVALVLQRTRLGTSMRAVADNKDLSESSGINVERVILYTWGLGTALAGLGGVMLGLSDKVEWDGGFKLLLLIFAAVVVGGLGTAYGPVLGALLLGVAIQISTIWFDVEFKLVFALMAMILMLLVRPQGILGRKERVG